MDLDKLSADLKRDEGWLPYLYDDANDRAIKSGYTVIGHPSIGYGFALDVAPLSEAEAGVILNMRARGVCAQLCSRFPWVSSLTEPRQRALGNMYYNLGPTGFGGFITFLQLMKNGQFSEAADDLLQTKWAIQVGPRANRIAELIVVG